MLFKKKISEKCFSVIDTETNWSDEVMSIGVVIADSTSLKPVKQFYFIITPECSSGGMYSAAMIIRGVKVNLKSTRDKVIQKLTTIFQDYHVDSIFAYNASFDYKHLPELQAFQWYDIMKIAAYKQYNKKIPENADCWSTGKLKRGYGVEPILRMLSNNPRYFEKHNALCDAVDELKIIQLLTV